MINATVFTFELKLLRSRHLHFCHLLSWLQSMCAMNKSRETFTTYTAARTMKHTTPHFFFRFYLVIILTLSWNCWDPYPCIFVTYHFGFSPCVQWTRAAKLSLLRRPYEQRSTPLHIVRIGDWIWKKKCLIELYFAVLSKETVVGWLVVLASPQQSL